MKADVLNNNGESARPALGAMMEEALDRSVTTSLDSLASLRVAVRSYTHQQRNRGMALDSVMRAVSAVLMELEDERRHEAKPQAVRDPELAQRLRAWCGEDYSEAR